MELHQNTLWEKRSFCLLPDELKLSFKNIHVEREQSISYESLANEAYLSSRQNSRLLLIAFATIAFAGCVFIQSLLLQQRFYHALFPFIAGILLAILARYRQQNYIIIETSDRQKIVFWRDKPNRQALEKFLTQLWLYRKRYLRKKYFYIDYNRNLARQTIRLKWLLEQNVISQTEFEFAREDWVILRSERSPLRPRC